MKAKARTWKPRKRSPRPYVGRSKYRAVPTVVDGIRFHSKREAARYQELRIAEKVGEITDLELQPVFNLHAFGATSIKDKLIGRYVADFRYKVPGLVSNPVVEDVKGCDTPLSKWKRKHVAAQYGITVEIVK